MNGMLKQTSSAMAEKKLRYQIPAMLCLGAHITRSLRAQLTIAPMRIIRAQTCPRQTKYASATDTTIAVNRSIGSSMSKEYRIVMTAWKHGTITNTERAKRRSSPALEDLGVGASI